MEMLGIIKGLILAGELDLASKMLSGIITKELKDTDAVKYSELKLVVNQ